MKKIMPRMTLSKARQLAMQEFGYTKTSSCVHQDEGMPKGYFIIELGFMKISIHNDDDYDTGCIMISVRMNSGHGDIFQLYDPYTLKENFAEEDRLVGMEREARLSEWVSELGPEKCHAIIDRVWNSR